MPSRLFLTYTRTPAWVLFFLRTIFLYQAEVWLYLKKIIFVKIVILKMANKMTENPIKNEVKTEISTTEPVFMESKPRLQVWEAAVTVQRTKVIKRLTFKGLFYEIAEAFNLDRGLIYTLKGLTIRPAQTIREYLDTGRDLVTNPMKYFLFIVGSILILASQNGYFTSNQEFVRGVETGMKNYSEDEELSEGKQKMVEAIVNAYNDYYVTYQDIWFIVTIIFTSFFTYLFFKKRGYNFIEHNVINTYVFVHTYLIFGLIVLFKLNMDIWFYPYFGAYLVMSVVVYKRLFEISWWTTIWKTFLAFMSSIFLFYILIFIATVIIAIQQIK